MLVSLEDFVTPDKTETASTRSLSNHTLCRLFHRGVPHETLGLILFSASFQQNTGTQLLQSFSNDITKD